MTSLAVQRRDFEVEEVARLDRHFREVIATLSRRPPSGLLPAQKTARAKHLDRLEGYRRTARFPKNRLRLGRTPIFVDASGTRCAMAHLIEAAGGGELVRHIASSQNYARIPELGATPQLAAWLGENGLTLDEAARIQPSYCLAASDCFCQQQALTLLEGEVTDTLAFSVTAVHGDEAQFMAGDELPLFELYGLGPGVQGIAVPYEGGDTTYANLRWPIVDGEIYASGCHPVGAAPGPLPPSVFVEALIPPPNENCKSVLYAHDPAWGKKDGDCGNTHTTATTGPATSSTTAGAGGGDSAPPAVEGGCSVAPGGSAMLAFATFAGALALVRRRR